MSDHPVSESTPDPDEPRVAIVTGAATGIGRAAAEVFAGRGHAVVAVDISSEALDWASEREHMRILVGDVSDDAVAAEMVTFALETFGRLDTVVLNAGIARRIGWQDADAMALFDRIMSVNVRGVVSGIRHAAPAMAERGGGAIVATASLSGVGADPERWAYNASKAAGSLSERGRPGTDPHANSSGRHRNSGASRGTASSVPAAATRTSAGAG